MAASLLAPRTVQSIRELIRRSKLTPVGEQRGGAVGRIPLLVRCTSVTPAGSGVGAECYPAVVVDPDSSELVADQPELGEVWLTLIADGAAATPAVDAIYEGLLSGDFDPGSDERPRVFATAGVRSVEESFGDYTITSDNTWEDITDSDTVVGPGTYLFFANLSAWANMTTGTGAIFARLYNATAAAALDSFAYGTALVTAPIATVDCFGSGTLIVPKTLTVESTIRVQALRRPFVATWTTSVIRMWDVAAGTHTLRYLSL